MQFPDDATLVARGKYSTLGKERRKQLKRVQDTAGNLMGLCQQAMHGVQADQADTKAIATMQICVDSLKDAGEKIVSLGAEMNVLKPEAWPE